MTSDLSAFRSRPAARAQELIDSIALAESVVLATIEREGEALRARRMLAANALHTRLCDAARLYLDAARAAQAGIEVMERAMPGCRDLLEARRAAFSPILKIQLAVLSAQRAAVETSAAASRPAIVRSVPIRPAQRDDRTAPRIPAAPQAPTGRPSASPRRRSA